MDEEAMVIIQGLRSPQTEFSFLENIELQNGKLEDMLKDAVRQNDSVARPTAAVIEEISEDEKSSIDEKMTDLVVAYESKFKQTNDGVISSQESTHSMSENQGKSTKAPAGRGLGIIIGEPTCLSIKTWKPGSKAMDFEIGRSITGRRIHIAADYLIHFPHWIKTSNFQPYLGIGGRAKSSSEAEEARFRVGARFGAGIEYIHGLFGVYGEFFPVLDILPEIRIALEGGIGVRYYFNN